MLPIVLREPQNIIKDLWCNMHAGFWSLCGSRRSFQWVVPTISQFLLIFTLALAANCLFSWIDTAALGKFNPQGLFSYLIWPLMALILGLFISNRKSGSSLVLVPVTLWLMSDTFVTLGQTTIQLLWHKGWLPSNFYDPIGVLFFVVFIWQTVAVLWIIAKLFHWPWWEQILMLCGAFAVLGVWEHSANEQPIWLSPKMQLSVTLSDQVIYAQARLLEDELAQIQSKQMLVNVGQEQVDLAHSSFATPQEDSAKTNPSHWYWMGIAGAGYQDVFKNEISYIRTLLEEQYGFYGRSAVLINESNSLEMYPIATKTSIERMLGEFAKKMDLNNDVLMIYMSSHGRAGVFELSDPPLKMESITSQWLREALDRAGIKWQVVIVSSCYSGSFIPALQSPNNVVITASAADAASFGCETGREMTYFGQALFGDALKKSMILSQHASTQTATQSTPQGLEQWFHLASQSVTQLEEAQHRKPSKPQFKMGKNFALRADQFTRDFYLQTKEQKHNPVSAIEMYEQLSKQSASPLTSTN